MAENRFDVLLKLPLLLQIKPPRSGKRIGET